MPKLLSLSVLLTLLLTLHTEESSATDEVISIPIGPSYHGTKSRIAVKDFAVAIKGAPEDLASGFKEMLETALFESNYFEVVDRADALGISAEKLLSEEFLKDPDAILRQGKTLPADILIYGAVTDFEGGGWGLVFKMPGVPVTGGGAYSKTKIIIEIRAVDSASGQVIFTRKIEGSALGERAVVGTVLGGTKLPVEMNFIKHTPMELAVRDCIYRTVISLCGKLPRKYFRY